MAKEGCSKNGINSNENGGSRTFEEELYWTNFKSMRFFQFLPSDFQSHLMIPEKFSKNMMDKLPQMVAIKGPGGAKWEVQLVRDNNNALIFRDGWKEFVKAHNFKENDLLVFKYFRQSFFKVWVFSGRNLCEKAGSYFVRKSALGKNDAGENSQLKRKNTRESSAEAVGNKENSELDEDSNTERVCAETSGRKSQKHSVCGLKNLCAEAKVPSSPYTPNGDPPSAADKERALLMARRESTNASFTLVMKATNVSQFYRLGISAPWSRTYLARKNQYIELRANGRKWTARFNVQSRRGGGVLVSGWSKFAIDNSLQEFDVCLFKLVSQMDEPAIFDVQIFRAAPDVAHQPSRKPSSV